MNYSNEPEQINDPYFYDPEPSIFHEKVKTAMSDIEYLQSALDYMDDSTINKDHLLELSLSLKSLKNCIDRLEKIYNGPLSLDEMKQHNSNK